MSHLADRYTRLCHSYIKLSDKFQKLDVDHMTLRSKVVPLIKLLQTYKQTIKQLTQDKEALASDLQSMTLKYEELKPLEAFLQPEAQAALAEAEEQLELVDITLQEMESDRDPDLSEIDKAILTEYQANPDLLDKPMDLPTFEPANGFGSKEKVLQSI